MSFRIVEEINHPMPEENCCAQKSPPTMADGDSKDLIMQLHSIGGVKLGSFILKTGLKSPIYFDLRVMISHPKLMVSTSLSESTPCLLTVTDESWHPYIV